MHTTEHTDLDGDALTVTRNGDLVWVTVTKGGDELTFGPISAHALEAREPLGSYVRHEDPALNADGRPYCHAERAEFACSREDGHDGPHVAATRDVQNSICEVWPAAESRPLTPDAISADAYERGVPRLRAALGYDMSPLVAHEVVKDIVAAVLTEPPQRPEGAEEIERLLIDADRDGGEVYRTDGYAGLADYLAEGLSKGGVRVVTEDGAA